jgi:Na+/H+ antiporter NhaC
MSVMVVYKPAFVLLHVNITGPWNSEKSLQVLEEVSQALSRSKKVVGLIIAGIAALITLIASTTASAIALIQEVKTATFVNHLAKNKKKKKKLLMFCLFKKI